MPARMDSQVAMALMEAAGFDPLELYKSAQALWLCRCPVCKREVRLKYVNVKRGFDDCPLCVEDQRVAIMRKAGLEPLEDYPGTKTGWRSRCAAGHVVAPWFTSVRAGKSSGCFYCAGLAPTPPEEAEAEARAAGYEPLEPYPRLTKAKWRCRHLLCGDEVLVRLENIRAGKGCCMRCGIAASATARSASAEGAAELMRSAGLRPLEPYPGGSHLPWRSECLTCGAHCSPTRANIWRGQGGCVGCGAKLNAALRLGDADVAFLDMVAVGLLPQAPYAGVNKPWPCRCTECGSDVQPRLGHVRSRGGGCLKNS